jgi:uncharacterized protein YprB with RNaseH-like and TPR domain
MKVHSQGSFISNRLPATFDGCNGLVSQGISQRRVTFTPLNHVCRLFPEFAQDCVYLDIETTGLSTVFDTVTMVGLYDGRKYQLFVDGENLQDLPKHLEKYSVMITFNG